MDKETILKTIWGDERLEVFLDFAQNSKSFKEDPRVLTEEEYVYGIFVAFCLAYSRAIQDVFDKSAATTMEELHVKAREYVDGYIKKMSHIDE